MSAYLLDTNVVSELRKPSSRRDAQINVWAEGLNENQAYISVLTVVEIERGILMLERKDPLQASILRGWFEKAILEGYAERIIPFTLAAARIAASLQVPNPRSLADSLIAATALEHDLILATRNSADFQDMNIRMVNPWKN
jgi:predicted nucleic acid-binding protein